MSVALEDRLRIVMGDITRLEVDAIVTAANEDLCGGGGVDGAVHAAAGPELVAASRALAPCPAGSARITPAFNLNVDFVIHAVGPVFRDLTTDSPTLASAYQSALSLAADNKAGHLAFPCISTGVYGFPRGPACDVATRAVIDWLRQSAVPETVTFCCFQLEDAALYRSRLRALGVVLLERT